MTLFKGRHLIGMQQKYNDQGAPTGEWEPSRSNIESSVEYELADFGVSAEYGADGMHEVVWAKLRKVH